MKSSHLPIRGAVADSAVVEFSGSRRLPLEESVCRDTCPLLLAEHRRALALLIAPRTNTPGNVEGTGGLQGPRQPSVEMFIEISFRERVRLRSGGLGVSRVSVGKISKRRQKCGAFAEHGLRAESDGRSHLPL